MTNEVAIGMLRAIRANPSNHECKRWVALSMAIDALEKQIPTKPCFDKRFFLCPKCSNYVPTRATNAFCQECGQLLGWILIDWCDI